ncbi:aminoacyl-tRNA hydrolase [bacterium]|nr:aminoacyl-tRNA hydrolase [bacterium]
MQENKPILIVGLGNPGPEYSNTRHNVGFMAVRHLAGGDATWRTAHHAMISTANIDGHRVIFAMPQTYMNLSGNAVGAIMAFYKVPLENVTVIHDDLDLPVGDMREKVGGGSAGHNGIKSIDAMVGRDYRRIRIGIGHPRDTGHPIPVADWVLGKIPNDDIAAINQTISELKLF